MSWSEGERASVQSEFDSITSTAAEGNLGPGVSGLARAVCLFFWLECWVCAGNLHGSYGGFGQASVQNWSQLSVQGNLLHCCSLQPRVTRVSIVY